MQISTKMHANFFDYWFSVLQFLNFLSQAKKRKEKKHYSVLTIEKVESENIAEISIARCV